MDKKGLLTQDALKQVINNPYVTRLETVQNPWGGHHYLIAAITHVGVEELIRLLDESSIEYTLDLSVDYRIINPYTQSATFDNGRFIPSHNIPDLPPPV